MRLFLLTAITMTAFAANSVLNRMALAGEQIDPLDFSAIRVVSGALVLLLIVGLRGKWRSLELNPLGVLGLCTYMLGFSYAYLSLDAGLGALLLFGVVQVTMFVGALMQGEKISQNRWIGTGIALSGLAVLLVPTASFSLPLVASGAMILAAIGWGVYSIVGRSVLDPTVSTASNFLWSSAVVGALCLVFRSTSTPETSGVLLAIFSGAVTSGLGYALWYAVLPRLETTQAALAQLTVPLIAFAGGAALLGEAFTLRFGIACLLVLGGIVLAQQVKRP